MVLNKLEGWKAKSLSFAGKLTLIKSVLASIPIHTLSCMAVPKSTIQRMENIMKAFIWSQHGQKRLHWVAWKEVCTPFKEGRLGIRSLQDTVYGLQGKLAWKVYAGNTIWTKLLRQKYGTKTYTRQQSASTLWRKIYRHLQNFDEIDRWSVGQGTISFWKDNWLGMILDRTNSSDITVCEGLQEIDKWRPSLTDEEWSKAKLVVLDDHVQDELKCTLSASGKFRIADYVKNFRNTQPKKEWADIVWNKYTSFRVNAFTWRMLRGAIPVDQNVQRRGIPFSSMCVCCKKPNIGTLDHLIIHSDVARVVWDHFATKLNKCYMVQSIEQLFRTWLHGCNRRSQLGMTTLAIILYGMWEIWKIRCRMKFEEERFYAHVLLRRVYNHLYGINRTNSPKCMPTTRRLNEYAWKG